MTAPPCGHGKLYRKYLGATCWPHEERFKNVIGAEQICDMVNCVSLVCNFYVLCVTSPFFRGCVRDVCERGALSRLEEVIQLPEDRRELTLIAEGQARETTTGQVVDLNQLNRQRERQELVKQQSASDSISSTASSITVLGEHGQAASGGAHPRTKTQADSNKGPHPESLDRTAERTESKGGEEKEAVGPSDPATLSLTSSPLQNHPDGTISTHGPRQQKAQTPPTSAANEGQKSPDCYAKNPIDRVTSPAGVPEQPPHRTGNQTEPSPDREDPKSPQNESHGKEEERGAATERKTNRCSEGKRTVAAKENEPLQRRKIQTRTTFLLTT